jgi:hypothetical protein
VIVRFLIAAAVLWLCAAIPALAQSWVELAGDGALSARMVVAPGVDCPTVIADGSGVASARRGGPDRLFPVQVCEARVPMTAARLAAAGIALPTVPPRVNRIVVIGDTGCRVEGRGVQDCNDPVAWPFAAIARAAAARRPDLVIHVGDYYYREGACPGGRAGCAGSPHGDAWPTWQADFFQPAAPLLAVAPWVMVRGNHEACRRGGIGWFRLLDPAASRPDCVDRTPPYRVSAGGIDLLLVDSADADDFFARPEKVATYAGELVPALAALPPRSWLLSHRPIWAMAQGDLLGVVANQTLQAAIRGHVPPGLDLVLSGHLHDFISYDFGPERPAQLIVGTGGDKLLPLGKGEIVGTEIDGLPVRRGFAAERFGYLLLERDGAGWNGTLYAPDDAVLARCRIEGRALDCR